jgi:hypothetical protein
MVHTHMCSIHMVHRFMEITLLNILGIYYLYLIIGDLIGYTFRHVVILNM